MNPINAKVNKLLDKQVCKTNLLLACFFYTRTVPAFVQREWQKFTLESDETFALMYLVFSLEFNVSQIQIKYIFNRTSQKQMTNRLLR